MNVRQIVRKHVEEQSLREYLGSKYDSTSIREKNKFLKHVSTTIDGQVELILKSFVEDIKKGSPESKKRIKTAVLTLIVTAITTPAIGYAVNVENWIFVGVLSIVLAIVQIYNVFNE
jgi:hypothetical protein